MKLLLKIFFVIVLGIVIAAIAITSLIDPNDYKAEIEQQGSQSLNRELELNGDLGWSFFPRLAVTSDKVFIKNPKGFNRDNLMEVGDISVGINIIPLLSGKLEVGLITLNKFRLNVITNSKGKSNLDGISDANNNSSAVEEQPSSSPSISANSLSVEGISIVDAQIEVQDLLLKTNSLLDVKEITLSKFELGKSSTLTALIALKTDAMQGELKLTSNITVDQAIKNIGLRDLQIKSELTGDTLPNGKLILSLTANANADIEKSLLELSDIAMNANDIQLTGQAKVTAEKVTKIRYTLKGNVWNLDQFIPAQSTTTSAETTEQPEVEPDLSFLKGLDVDGKLSIEGIKVMGLTIGQSNVRTLVKNGSAKLWPLTAKLYQGKVKVNAEVISSKGGNRYSVVKEVSDVQIRPLLTDLADIDLIAGTASINFKGTGRGLTPTKVKQALKGTGNFSVIDGALYGINIPAKIRSAKAMLSGNTTSEKPVEQKTDFSKLVGDFTVADGIANNTSLVISTPFLRIDGKGTANIIEESLDYRLTTKVVGTSKGQGNVETDDLTGVTIPLQVTGSFADPKFGLDTESALKAKLDQKKDEAKDKLKDKAKDKLKEKFGKFFN